MGYNNYIFDWNMVLQLDPSYKRFLIDILSEEYLKFLRYRYLSIDVDDEDTDGDELFLSELQKEEEYIVNLLHNDNIGALREDTDVVWMNLDVSEDKYGDPIDYTLHPKYENPKHVCDPIVLLLPPPRSVLAIGSKIWHEKDNSIYEVITNQEHQYAHEIVGLKKTNMYTKENKVGMYSSVYRFDRKHNVTREIKHAFSQLVYNLKTRKMYYIHKYKNPQSTKLTPKPAIRRVIQISMNIKKLESYMSMFHNSISDRFTQYMHDYIVQEIPDLYTPNLPVTRELLRINNRFTVGSNKDIMYELDVKSYYNNLPFYYMIQHKVGQRLEWVEDSKFLDLVSEFAEAHGIMYKHLTSRENSKKYLENADNMERNFKRRTLYKIIPNLCKKPSQKTITKTIFGKYFKKFYHNVMTMHQHNLRVEFKKPVDFLFRLSGLIEQNLLPKPTYHLIVHLVKLHNDYSVQQLTQMAIALSTLTNVVPKTTMVEQYTTVVNNTKSRGEVLSWHTFSDAITMATRYNTRIRINKFKTVDDVKIFHDRFAEYQQRDLQEQDNFCNYEFLKFECPDKEYGGFTFKQLTNSQELIQEGGSMHHCVGGYSGRCLRGDSLIFSMQKEGRSYATIELRGESDYPVRQQYTIGDATIRNSEILNNIAQWQSDLSIMHKNDKTTYNKHAITYYQYQQRRIELGTKITECDAEELVVLDPSKLSDLVSKLNNLINVLDAIKGDYRCQENQINDFEPPIIEDNINADVQHADIEW